MTKIDELVGHLGAAIVQSIDSDDQIIMGHVREAHDIAKQVRAELTQALSQVERAHRFIRDAGLGQHFQYETGQSLTSTMREGE